jgi:hypothetical protein
MGPGSGSRPQTSRKYSVLDLNANNGGIYTPAYGTYKNRNDSRVALFNYITGAALKVTGSSTGLPPSQGEEGRGYWGDGIDG